MLSTKIISTIKQEEKYLRDITQPYQLMDRLIATYENKNYDMTKHIGL